MRADEADAHLRERLVAGDDRALAEAYDRWSALVHTVAARITGDRHAAEDLTQDVFMHLWQSPERYDPARGALRAWLCLVARGRALDWVRSRQVRSRRYAIVPALPEPPEPSETVTWQTEAKVIRKAVRELPEPQRAAVMLAYYGGLTYRQVARELNIPEGTAKSRIRQALSTLSARLTAEGVMDR